MFFFAVVVDCVGAVAELALDLPGFAIENGAQVRVAIGVSLCVLVAR